LGLETVRLAVERYPDSRFWVEVGGRGGEVVVEVGEEDDEEVEAAREAARALFLSFLAAFLIWDLLSPAVEVPLVEVPPPVAPSLEVLRLLTLLRLLRLARAAFCDFLEGMSESDRKRER